MFMFVLCTSSSQRKLSLPKKKTEKYKNLPLYLTFLTHNMIYIFVLIVYSTFLPLLMTIPLYIFQCLFSVNFSFI